ncbi:unnamed protein product [Didymodactylos carnosus]|uniref:Berberine/berberine-like domain-containing protein n=1 Tax=Didymodactylos carnosus TaxID=1234261 RepID=A0A814AWD1_9BILA|nr:unnamed protein product [Didymodactylos carnosus]CAF3700353.1 unnamed protein product [Didymodactylos carnosus]
MRHIRWTDSSWRSDQVGAMQYFSWENVSCSISNIKSSCTQGSIPVFAVNATWPEHIRATIQFASTNNLRLVIKATGHDLLGRSTAFGSLLLWLHYMKNMTLIPQYSSVMVLQYRMLFLSLLYYFYVLNEIDPTSYNGIVGSRLIPETIVRNQTDTLAQAFLQMKRQSLSFSQLTISMVSGGQASNTSNKYNSVNPAWHTALLHVFYAKGWPDDASVELQQASAVQISRQIQMLDTLANGDQLACYMNEADPNEPNWQHRFFGSQTLYNRLKSVKQKYDPSGLFVDNGYHGDPYDAKSTRSPFPDGTTGSGFQLV